MIERLDGGASRQLGLFAVAREFVEVKAFSRGRVFSLACRWCARRGYHLRTCPRQRRSELAGLSELEVRWHYTLELARRELANTGGRRMR